MIYKLLKYYLSLFYWERASIKSVKKMQLKKFREIFEYARENSKFYKDLYTKHGVMDLKIETWEDVEKVPVIDKYDFKKYDTKDIITIPLSNTINLHTTSGSSGEPLKIYFNKFEDYTAHIRVFFALRKIAKYKPWHRFTLITRYEENENFQIEGDLSLLRKVQNLLNFFRREIISIYREPDYIIDRLQKNKPYILWSTPSVLEIVVNRLIETNISLNIPYLYFTSENLSQVQYEKFKKHISNNIIDIYGAMESPCLGYEHNKIGKRKVYPNSNLFELLNHRVMDEHTVGDVFFTNLINYTMPIIRYDIKDISVIIENDEYFPNKYIGNIIGRIDDILDFPDGNKFVHHHAYEMFMDFEECEQFKFEQKGTETIQLLLKPNKKFSEEQIKTKAIERWNKRFEKYPINIIFIEKFEINSKTGKFKNIEKIK
jgi:phenylacetate-CoA ligase